MLVKKAFRFELMPKGGHIRRMKQSCGCARFVFNRALAYQKDLYESDKTSRFSYTRLADFLPAWKKEFPWLKDCHSQMLQQSLKDLGSAYRNFFSNSGKVTALRNARQLYSLHMILTRLYFYQTR